MKEKIISFFSFLTDEIINLTPQNPLAYVYFLLFVTFFSLLIIFYLAKKNKKKNIAKKEHKELSIDDLLKIADNPKSGTADLYAAFKLYNDRYSVDMYKDKSMELFRKILNHKHRNKKLFDYFHGAVLPKNIRYKEELDKLEKEALNNDLK